MKKKYIFLGGIYLLLLQFCFFVFIYFSMPGYKKAYLLKRINLLFPVDNKYIEHYLFTVPDGWSNGLNYNVITPSSYINGGNKIEDTLNFEPSNNDYLQELALENDKSSTLVESEKFRFKFQQSLFDCSFTDVLKSNIGFVPIRAPFASASKNNIFDRNQIKLPILFEKGIMKKTFVIALHGRNSTPKALFGSPFDYANGFASFWKSDGFNVFALAVGSTPNISVNFPRLGLSEIGSDLAKIEDLVFFIENTYGTDCHIVIVGISYGAILAEYAALLFKGIDGVVSIGGSARYDFLTSEFSLSFKNTNSNSDIWLNQSLSNLNIYKLILKKNKFLLSSTGISDAGQYGDSGQSKYRMMKSFLNVLKSKKFSHLFFRGVHESNPKLEISEYLQLLERNKINLN